MVKRWIFPKKRGNTEIIDALLESRGVTGKEAMEEFLSSSPQLTFDPFLMKDMTESVDRILLALDNGENICVYGDYDADGVCGVSLMIEILRLLGAEYSYYIPSRFDEGYGLNCEAIEKIKERGTDLIITVDCGSSSYEEVLFAMELGMDIIVTDHHNLGAKPAPCLLINPKQDMCTYPDKDLSGCGVAFKLAQALNRRRPQHLSRADLNSLLDLAAIATVGDIVSLTGENRTIVKYGIRYINSKKRPGLTHLIDGAGLAGCEIKSDHIAYIIVPHLNAAGRMLSAETGVKLLTCHNEEEWKEAAENLLSNNRERKRIQDMAYEEAIKRVEESHLEDKFIVLDLPDAHEGITGIVAGKIKDKYNRPTIIVTPSGENKLKGTGRSIDGLNIYEMLSECGQLFEKFGGHAGACGFTMDNANLQPLRNALGALAVIRFNEDPSLFDPKLIIDAEVISEDLDNKLIDCLNRLEPFGHKNPKPIFVLRKVQLKDPCYIGEHRQHVRFGVNGAQCIYFNGAEQFISLYEGGKPVDIAGYPEINRWNGCERIQFVVSDMRLSDFVVL